MLLLKKKVGGSGSEELMKYLPPSLEVLRLVNVRERKTG